MGKSVLLRELALGLGGVPVATGPKPPMSSDGAVLLWDVPRGGGALPEGEGRVILARRRETPVGGLSRLRLYGATETIGATELCIGLDELVASGLSHAAARSVLADTAGWPVLAGLAGSQRHADLLGFFTEEVTATLPLSGLVALSLALAGRPMPEQLRRDLPPLPASPEIAAVLSDAVRGEIARRARQKGEAMLLSRIFLDCGQAAEAIRTLQRAGDMEGAIALLEREGADYFIHRHGPEAFDEVLAGFNGAGLENDPILLAARVMQAAKSGELPLALRLLTEHYGPAIHQPERVFAPTGAVPVEARLLRLVIFIYEDIRLSEPVLQQAALILGSLPLDADLLRGSYYNAILEFRVRTRRYALARDAAVSAMRHYRKAKVPILEFYVSLHLAVVELMSGTLPAARRAMSEAAAALARVSFDSPGDHRIIALVTAVAEYETGRPELLAEFIDLEFEAFTQGELWPSLSEIALHYGSALIAARDGVNPARGFLERLRLHRARAQKFHTLITVREAVILQNAGRWHEAAEMLQALAEREPALDAPPDGLASADDREVIAFALARLRSRAYDATDTVGAARALAVIARNPRLTHHQRATVAVLSTWLQRRDRDASGVRRALRSLFEAAARDGSIAALAAEHPFLDELLANRRIRDYLDSSASCQAVLRRLADIGTRRGEIAVRAGLTRREARILDALREGASNKLMAKTLSLSESTVKFHLGNLYRKLGVTTRREAIAQADREDR